MANSSDGQRKEYRETREREPTRDTRERESYRERENYPPRDRDYREREPARETREREPAREVREREPVRDREPVPPISKGRTNVTVKVPAPVTTNSAPAPPVPAPGPDLLNWDEPVRAPPVIVEPEKEDFFGEFSGASTGGGGGQPQKPDKNAILQLYKTPIAPVAYNNMPPPQPMYPGPNYNLHSGPNYNVHMVGGYAPNPYGMPPNMPPNYNMNMGRGGPMGPPVYMGAPPTVPAAIPPGYFNKPANYGPSPAYAGAPSYPNYGPPSYGAPSPGLGAANTNHLVAGLGNLRM